MAQPTPYYRQNSFALFSAENPGEPHSGVTLDTEFNAVKVALDETQSNLAMIQSDDGRLAPLSVGREQLDSSITIGFESPQPWAPDTDYTESISTVFQEARFYTCTETHTSGDTFDDTHWLLVADLSVAAALPDGGVTEAKIADAAVTATKIVNNAVTTSKIAAQAVSTAKIADQGVTTAKIADSNVTTAKIADSNVTTAKIADDAVTYAKLQNASGQYKVLARKSASAGDFEECSLTDVLDFVTGAVRGDILMRGATDWERLAKGTTGQHLQSPGASADVSWGSAGGQLLHVREEKANNVASGCATTANSWVTRILDTTKTNEIASASIASNTITLPAGTYEIDADAVMGMQTTGGDVYSLLRLYNSSDSSVVLVGVKNHVISTASTVILDTPMRLTGRFTLASSKDVRLEHFVRGGTVAAPFRDTVHGMVEVYTDIRIRRVA